MNLTHPTTDPYHYFQSSTESVFSMIHNMVFVKSGPLNMLFWKSPMNQIQTNMDRKLYTCRTFIDLQKAFDTVDHSILLKKLDRYGIRGILNDWFTSYLTSRKQMTEIGPLNIQVYLRKQQYLGFPKDQS